MREIVYRLGLISKQLLAVLSILVNKVTANDELKVKQGNIC